MKERLRQGVAYLLLGLGVVALLGGLVSLNLTPFVLGAALLGLGTLLDVLGEVSRKLAAAASVGRYLTYLERNDATSFERAADQPGAGLRYDPE